LQVGLGVHLGGFEEAGEEPCDDLPHIHPFSRHRRYRAGIDSADGADAPSRTCNNRSRAAAVKDGITRTSPPWRAGGAAWTLPWRDGAI
jgi:hypothetical protein